MIPENLDWKPSFIYFDLDDTLLDHKQAEQRSLSDVYSHFGAEIRQFPLDHIKEVYHHINVDLWTRYAAGDVTKAELRIQRFEKLLAELNLHTLPAEEVCTFYLSRYHKHWALKPGAGDAFQLISEHFPVGILTNGFAEIQHAKLAQFPELKERSRALVISEEVGYLKPHPALFSHATSLAEVNEANILYVGDSFRSDVEGSLNAGWKPAWFTTTKDVPDHIYSFSEWNTLLDSLQLL